MTVSGDWPGYSKTFPVPTNCQFRDIAAIVVAIAVELIAMLANYLLLLKALILLSSLCVA